MKITIEIGTPEVQKAINKELSVIEHICELFDPPTELQEIIIPSDFDRTINNLQGRNDFISSRTSHNVVAKIIKKCDQSILVLSPLLYNEKIDFLCRAFYYLHEISHLYDDLNSYSLPCCDDIPPFYIGDMYCMYGEYCADRKSYEIIDELYPEQSEIYKQFILDMYGGHINTISEDEKFYDIIKKEIKNFREHDDIERFFEKIKMPFHEVAIAIAHAYAGLDHFSSYSEFEQKLKFSKFHNDKTINLMAFIKNKYSENDMNLLDGISLMEAFETNFGIKYEFLESGELYCHVLDI